MKRPIAASLQRRAHQTCSDWNRTGSPVHWLLVALQAPRLVLLPGLRCQSHGPRLRTCVRASSLGSISIKVSQRSLPLPLRGHSVHWRATAEPKQAPQPRKGTHRFVPVHHMASKQDKSTLFL